MVSLRRALAICMGMTFPCFSLASAENPYANQGPRIEYYLQFAFGASETIRKFKDRPQATLICPFGKCGKGLSDRVWNAVPAGDELLFAKAYTSSMDIALVPSVAEGTRIVDFEIKRLKNFKYQWWGDQRCRTAHFSRGDWVRKVVVIADPKEGDQANAICFAMEMVKGSGMAFWLNYDYLLQQDEVKQKDFILNMGALLKFHWARLVEPGATKQQVRDAWREKFEL